MTFPLLQLTDPYTSVAEFGAFLVVETLKIGNNSGLLSNLLEPSAAAVATSAKLGWNSFESDTSLLFRRLC